jgi:hypothetical protein
LNTNNVPLVEHIFSTLSKYMQPKFTQVQLPARVKTNGCICPGELRRLDDRELSIETLYNYRSRIDSGRSKNLSLD